MSKPVAMPDCSIRVSECNSVARTLLLDLDGTLVNSVPDLAAALNRLMRPRGLAAFSMPEAALMVGDGVAPLVERAFAARGRAPDARRDCRLRPPIMLPHCRGGDHAVPGVADTLHALAGRGLEAGGLHQQAGGGRRGRCWQRSGWARCSRRSVVATVFRSASRTRRICWRHWGGGRRPARAVMAGDHANDVAAAQGAGVPCIFAAWGYGTAEMAAWADVIAQVSLNCLGSLRGCRPAVSDLDPDEGALVAARSCHGSGALLGRSVDAIRTSGVGRQRTGGFGVSNEVAPFSWTVRRLTGYGPVRAASLSAS